MPARRLAWGMRIVLEGDHFPFGLVSQPFYQSFSVNATIKFPNGTNDLLIDHFNQQFACFPSPDHTWLKAMLFHNLPRTRYMQSRTTQHQFFSSSCNHLNSPFLQCRSYRNAHRMNAVGRRLHCREYNRSARIRQVPTTVFH